jgi:hypothetical protein
LNAWSLQFSPLLPIAWIEALAVAALIVVALTFWRRPGAGVLRTLAAALLLLALIDPSLQREDRRPLKDVVAVVIDRSAGNRLGERERQADEVRAQIEKQLAGLDNVEARIVETRRDDPDNKGTELFGALKQALSETPPERVGGAIFVTDGIDHDIPSSPDALGFHAPLHVLITGHEGERDRRIELIEAPRFGIVGKDQTIRARVLDSDAGSAPATLTVKRDGQLIATYHAEIGETLNIAAPIDHAGANIFELEVDPAANALTRLDAKAAATIEGVRDKLRVLLVSGEPHPGERMWRNLLKSDANVDLVHFTILRPPEKTTDGTPINELSLIAFPVADLFGRKIRDFDLIIFDRYSSQAVLPRLYLDNIVKFVRDGGALLMAAGPEFGTPEGLFYTPLGEISPVRPTGLDFEGPFKAAISTDGAKHPITRGLPGGDSNPPSWGKWFRGVGAEPTAGVSIMQRPDGAPLLQVARVDKGRVALLLSDQLWLWARGYDGGGPHLDLLRRLAHWLMKEPELEEEALRLRTHEHEIIIERQSLGDAAPLVTLVGPDGKSRQAQLTPAGPGLSRAVVSVDDDGLYRAEDGERTALANVGPDNPLALREVLSTTERLRPIAEATGGGVWRLARDANDPVSVPRLASMHASQIYAGPDYAGLKRTEASELVGVARSPLAADLIGLIALLAALIGMWLWEGRRPLSSAP